MYSKYFINSKEWKSRNDRSGLLRRAIVKGIGYTDEDLNKPMIGIINTWSEANPGHYHLRLISDAVKRGVWSAGGFPLELNTISVCGLFHSYSWGFMFRNLISIITEEIIKTSPFDGIVLISTCDDVIPGQLMGAISADKPTILISGGSMLPGCIDGKDVVCGTDAFSIMQKFEQLNEFNLKDLTDIEGKLYGSAGACPMMGTANTMQGICEALGISLPYSSSPLAFSGEKMRLAEETGVAILNLAKNKINIKKVINKESVENALMFLMAVGGSSNAVIHLTAILRRLGLQFDFKRFNEISDSIPLIANVKPHGTFSVGKEFHNCGGVPTILKELEDFLNKNVLTSNLNTMEQNLKNFKKSSIPNVISSIKNPIKKEGSYRILTGNIAPKGALLKVSTANKDLIKGNFKAIVFDDISKARAFCFDENSEIDEKSILIVRGYGVIGGPGMPEVGNDIPVPTKLLKKGKKDILRMTDGRMSGSAYGSFILHVSPEAFIGGPISIIENGDIINIDYIKNSINLALEKEEFYKRIEGRKINNKKFHTIKRGFLLNFLENVLQPDEGCDLKYL